MKKLKGDGVMEKKYTQDDKYTLVGRYLMTQTGSFLDIGARDKILRSYLKLDRINYFSADLGEGYDYQIDLEKQLQIENMKFDHVSALDVLEHVENIHWAFSELARITRKTLFIALPNMSTLPRRWNFFWNGNLGTGKYALLTEHQGDRHRWLTIYPEIYRFIEENARKNGFEVDVVYEELEWVRLFWRINLLLANLGIFRNGIMTGRCTFILTRMDK